MRRTLVAFVLLCIIAGLFHERETLSIRARRLYWGWQCARHVVPQDTVLVEADPVKAASLLATNPDYQPMYDPVRDGQSRTNRKGPIAVYSPRAWQAFRKVEPRSRRMFPPVFGEPHILFLGQRTSAGGNQRIVVIASDGSINALRLPKRIPAVVLPKPTLFEPLPPTNVSGFGDATSGRFIPARLYPGVADPNDPSHLSIDFDVIGFADNRVLNKGTVDIYLGDDDRLVWKLRDPASTQILR